MGELTHKAARAAFGGAIDFAMRKMDKDREKGLLDIVDLTERFMEIIFRKVPMRVQKTDTGSRFQMDALSEPCTGRDRTACCETDRIKPWI